MRYGEVVSKVLWVQGEKEKIGNALLGLGGEVGEVLDHFKKEWFHPDTARKPQDLRLELGDILFYLALLNQELFGDSLLDLAKDNIRKLVKRWPERYQHVDLEIMTL